MKKRLLKLFIALTAAAGFIVPNGVLGQTSVPYSPLSVFLWTDKSAYLPGEAITLRWTARANGDTTPYTVVLYRQNNQTGIKTYMSIGGTPSSNAVDILGNTPDTGLTPLAPGDTTKSVIIGPGGWMLPQLTAPSELGMHTFVIEFRDATGTRIVKSVYTKFGIVGGFDTLTGNITTSRMLVNTRAYNLSGVVLVSGNATLTIEPGTFIFGQPGSQPPSMLMVGVNGKIHAAGTRSRPIIMTSSQPVGQRAAGDWGGLVMLGKAQVNVTGGVNNIEGLPPSADTTYGGSDNTHNCGTLAYVRVEFAGSILSPNNEINNITWGGCGSGTVAHHIQSRYGLDDMFE